MKTVEKVTTLMDKCLVALLLLLPHVQGIEVNVLERRRVKKVEGKQTEEQMQVLTDGSFDDCVSGGKVEVALQRTDLVYDVAVYGCKDTALGEVGLGNYNLLANKKLLKNNTDVDTEASACLRFFFQSQSSPSSCFISKGWYMADMLGYYHVHLTSIHMFSKHKKKYLNKMTFELHTHRGKTSCKDITTLSTTSFMFCCNASSKYRYVKVGVREGVNITQIAAYTKTINEMYHYEACVEDRGFSKSFSSKNNYSVHSCLIACRNIEYQFAALESGLCKCANNTNYARTFVMCSDTCGADRLPCGYTDEQNFESLYKVHVGVSSEQVGMLEDSIGKEVRRHSKKSSVETCLLECSYFSYHFFAMLNEENCVCLNVFNAAKTTTSVFHPIYAVCYNGYCPHKNCRSHKNVLKDEHTCTSGCKDGYSREDCSYRDCSDNNGDCGALKCQKFGEFGHCECPLGFSSNGYLNTSCHDINECMQKENKLCDLSRSVCINLIGSYHCVCHKGFINGEYDQCEDENECLYYECTDVNQVCRNTVGLFECICKEGFALISNKCVDIDECASETACPDDNVICENNQGNFTCQCRPHFIIDEGRCVFQKTIIKRHLTKFDVLTTRVLPLLLVLAFVLLIIFSIKQIKKIGSSQISSSIRPNVED